MADRIGDDNPNNLTGTILADFMDGKGGDDTLTAKAGADILIGGGGADHMDGGTGNDVFRIGDDQVAAGEIIDGGGDFDEIAISSAFGTLSPPFFTVNLAAANISSIELLRLTGDDAPNVNIRAAQIGGGLSSSLQVLSTVDGGLLNIVMNGDLSVNLSGFTFAGWNGRINLTGEGDGDRITGSSQADVITPGLGQDISKGLGGDDVFVLDSVLGNETEDGGAGFDTLLLGGLSTALGTHSLLSIEQIEFDAAGAAGGDQTVFLRSSQFGSSGISSALMLKAGDDGLKTVDIVLSGETNFDASNFQFNKLINVKISGGGLGDTITGSDSTDIINGNGGQDVLQGGQGSDVLDGGAGADFMFGGAGNDVYVIDDVDDKAIELLLGEDPGGFDSVFSTVSHTLASPFENLRLQGTDAIEGIGNDKANSMLGNGAANLLRGLAGADSINGGGGADTIFGGAGKDQFDYNGLGESAPGAATRDTIRNFQAGLDRFDLRDLDGNSEVDGVNEFVFDTGGKLGAGEIRLREASGGTFLEGNADGDAALEFQVFIKGVTGIDEAGLLV